MPDNTNVTHRMPKELLDRVDRHRGLIPRNAYMNELIRNAIWAIEDPVDAHSYAFGLDGITTIAADIDCTNAITDEIVASLDARFEAQLAALPDGQITLESHYRVIPGNDKYILQRYAYVADPTKRPARLTMLDARSHRSSGTTN